MSCRPILRAGPEVRPKIRNRQDLPPDSNCDKKPYRVLLGYGDAEPLPTRRDRHRERRDHRRLESRPAAFRGPVYTPATRWKPQLCGTRRLPSRRCQLVWPGVLFPGGDREARHC